MDVTQLCVQDVVILWSLEVLYALVVLVARYFFHLPMPAYTGKSIAFSCEMGVGRISVILGCSFT